MPEYELIDTDPNFYKVVRYFRPADWGLFGLTTAAAPALLIAMEKLEPLQGRKFRMPTPGALRVTTLIGAVAGFTLAYNDSTKRFWGWSENQREVAKDRYEVKTLLSKKQSPYGKSTMSEYLQDMASRNSTNSQLLLGIFPFFNFVSHQNHGIDLRKYYEVREGEEAWGFGELPPIEEINGLAIGNQYKKYTNYSEDF